MFFILVGCSGVPCSLSWLVAWPETGLRTQRRVVLIWPSRSSWANIYIK